MFVEMIPILTVPRICFKGVASSGASLPVFKGELLVSGRVICTFLDSLGRHQVNK